MELLRNILIEQNIGRSFSFIIDNIKSNKEHSIVKDKDKITYTIDGVKLSCIDDVMKQDRIYNYKVAIN